MTDFTMFDYKVTDGVAVATFNRPDKMNTFTPVGTEISIVAYMKNNWPVTGMPVANMW